MSGAKSGESSSSAPVEARVVASTPVEGIPVAEGIPVSTQLYGQRPPPSGSAPGYPKEPFGAAEHPIGYGHADLGHFDGRVAHPDSRAYSTNLFDCAEDPRSCAYGALCPVCQISETADRARAGDCFLTDASSSASPSSIISHPVSATSPWVPTSPTPPTASLSTTASRNPPTSSPRALSRRVSRVDSRERLRFEPPWVRNPWTCSTSWKCTRRDVWGAWRHPGRTRGCPGTRGRGRGRRRGRERGRNSDVHGGGVLAAGVRASADGTHVAGATAKIVRGERST